MFDVDAAAEKCKVIPKEGSRSGLCLDDLHRKASQVALGLLQEGADEGEHDWRSPRRPIF